MKSKEKYILTINAQAYGEAVDNHQLRRKLRANESRIAELEAQATSLNTQLCEKMDEVSEMMKKIVSFMMGNGDVALSDFLRDAVISGVLAEFEAREAELKASYERELARLTSDFNALKDINDGNSSTV